MIQLLHFVNFVGIDASFVLMMWFLCSQSRGVRFSTRSSTPVDMDTTGAADEQARKAASMARLLAKPLNPSEQRGCIAQPMRGVVPLHVSGSRRDGLMYIPKSYSMEKPAPVVVILHGAGGHAEGALQLISDFADVHGLILIAPESRGRTWDMILDRYGPDVEFINQEMSDKGVPRVHCGSQALVHSRILRWCLILHLSGCVQRLFFHAHYRLLSRLHTSAAIRRCATHLCFPWETGFGAAYWKLQPKIGAETSGAQV
uniref:Uncharacterized protein n=1 Tax=Physcomitrium patens TaxID=3218 RepID=A0A7I4CVN3_PHYPA